MPKLPSCLLLLLFLFNFSIADAGQHVYKHVLENGLTLLIHPVKTIQNVSTQLWFNVGSKHEALDEKGLAHWLEHMCFKGTQKMSESDVWSCVKKLSGSCNASTHYDWTHFYLDFPTQHWFEALPILSDMMTNCTFKQDLLNAELQVVIQEMKNNRDNFVREMTLNMMSSIFPDHPYHYPVIGYKSDLESLSREKLVSFYKKHYIPNNAILVIVGNVDPDDVIKRVTKHFGNKKADLSYTPKTFKSKQDICSKSVTLYRNVQKPAVYVAFAMPGTKEYHGVSFEILRSILTSGQNSRLYKKLVEDQKLVSSISSFSWGLHDNDVLFINFGPQRFSDVEIITSCIQDEITLLATEGPTLEEIKKTVVIQDSNFYNSLENNHSQARGIASSYLVTGNEDAFFEHISHDYEGIKKEIQDFCKKYLRSSVRHMGTLRPLLEEEQSVWKDLQNQSNEEDRMLLQNKARQSEVEQGKYVQLIHAQEPNAITLPKPETYTLSNGLKVLYYHNENLPKIEVKLSLKVDSWYEPLDKAPLCKIYNALLFEGTKNYSKEQLLTEIEKRGIGITIATGLCSMSTLNKEAQKAFELLTEILCDPLFPPDKLEKQKQLALSDYKNFWDNPRSIMCYLMGKHLYENEGFFHDPAGTPESIASITLEDIKKFHESYRSPDGATVAIVGDLSNINLIELLESTLGTWQGPKVEERKLFNSQIKKSDTEIIHAIEREQIILGFIGLSVTDDHEDYYPLLLFNQVFNSKLFNLRQKTNAFYWINGSVIERAGDEPGEVYIKTQVSQTRAQEAQELILNTIDTITDTFDQEDLIQAQQALANSVNSRYSTNASIASTFLDLHKNDRAYDYLVTLMEKIKKITVQEVRAAVKRVLNKDNMSVFKVGPVSACPEIAQPMCVA